MTRTQLADGMLYIPLHRADRPVDSCSAGAGLGPVPCEACGSYVGQRVAS